MGHLQKIPEWLSAGDRVALVSTARKVNREQLTKALSLTDSWGFELVYDEELFDVDNQFAGSDEHRARQFEKAFLDDTIKAFLCERGGYGTVRLLDYLDLDMLLRKPKWLVGYSDVTVLHQEFQQRGIASMHASMPVDFAKNTPRSIALIGDALKGNLPGYSEKIETGRTGRCEGPMIGGNLSVLYGLLAHQHNIDWSRYILFIEDLDEYLYHFDRMMMAFRQAGILHKIRGLIVGTIMEMRDSTRAFGFEKDNAFGHDVGQIISHAMKGTQCPWCMQFPAGHGVDNVPLYFGVEAEVKIGEATVEVCFG